MSTVESSYRLPSASRAQVWRAIGSIVASDKRAFILVLIMYMVAAAAGAAIPVLLGAVIDGVGEDWTAAQTDLVCLLVVACILGQFLFIRFGRRAGFRFGERAAATLRESCVERVLALPLKTVERAGVGDLATRSSSDINAVAELLRKTGPNVLIAIIEIVVVLAFAFAVHPGLGLLTAVSIPILCWGSWRYIRRAEAIFLSERHAMGSVANTLTASLLGSRTIASYRIEAERENEGHRKASDHFDRLFGILRLQTRFFPSIDLAFLVPTVLTVVVGGFWYLNGDGVTVGEIFAVAMLGIRMENPLKGIMMSINSVQEGGASFARIEGIRSLPHEYRTATANSSDISLDDVYFGYSEHHDVLKGLDLRIEQGDRVAIVGPSGAGKSTIARLISGTDRPRSGNALLGGKPAADIDVDDLRRRVILVTQEHHVFSTTVRNNLLLAAPDASDDVLLHALTTVGATWVTELDDGLDTEVGAQAIELGEAEAQQIALARVILADPDVVVLDEATVGIEADGGGNLEAALSAAFKGRTVITIVHHLQAAESADRVVVVDKGRIIESDSHSRLLETGGTYAQLWRTWQGTTSAKD